MWRSDFDHAHPVVVSAAAAVLCAVLTQHLSSQTNELVSETLSWMILPILFRVTTAPYIHLKSPTNSLWTQSTAFPSLWVVATGLAVSCLFKAEIGIVRFYPLLTPLILAAEKLLSSHSYTTTIFTSWLHSPLAWVTTLIALTSTLILSRGDLIGSSLSIIAVASQLLVYVSFLPRTITTARFAPVITDVEESIVPISRRTVSLLSVFLGIQTYLYGFTNILIASTSLLSLAKAFSWYFIIRTTRHTSWSIAAAIGTFSILSTRNPFVQTSEAQAILHVAASLVALAQVIDLIPQQAKARSSLWILCLIPILPYLTNLWAITSANSAARLSFSHSQKHPIEILANKAKADFDQMLQRQSKDYSSAHNEYLRRYGIEPPNGFKDWYEFATLHNSPIIDEFDTIYDSVSPFWKLSGKEILEVMRKAHATPGSDLWLCTISSNGTKTKCSHPHRTFDRHIGFMFNKLLGNASISLPDVQFLVNHLDEPRVLVPPDSPEEDSFRNGRFTLTNLSHRPTWDTLTKYCPPPQNTTETSSPSPLLPFITNRTSAIDLCQHPEFQSMHGLTTHPTSFPLLEGRVPLLSTGTLSTMGDILIPSPAYLESEFQYHPTHDPPWPSKHASLYWSGSTTGSYAHTPSWPLSHRQRFVALAQNLAPRPYPHLHADPTGSLSRTTSPFLNARLFDVAFTRIAQCAPPQCRAQSAFFTTRPWADRHAPLRSRLAFDLDGNGISGRYYQLLASRSVPLKQTLLREWHDERLVPWVHYVPVSLGLDELPEIVRYLVGNERGEGVARRIAEGGREWMGRGVREVDRAVYLYRLLLELARVLDGGREAGRW